MYAPSTWQGQTACRISVSYLYASCIGLQLYVPKNGIFRSFEGEDVKKYCVLTPKGRYPALICVCWCIACQNRFNGLSSRSVERFCIQRNLKKIGGNFGYMGRSNPWGDLDQTWRVGRYGVRNHVRNILWLLVKGCGCSESGNFDFFPLTWGVALTTLVILCDRVIIHHAGLPVNHSLNTHSQSGGFICDGDVLPFHCSSVCSFVCLSLVKYVKSCTWRRVFIGHFKMFQSHGLSGWFVPNITKSCLNLSKLRPKHCRSFFPDTVYIT